MKEFPAWVIEDGGRWIVVNDQQENVLTLSNFTFMGMPVYLIFTNKEDAENAARTRGYTLQQSV